MRNVESSTVTGPPDAIDTVTRTRLGRRGFLAGSAAVAGAATVGGPFAGFLAGPAAAGAPVLCAISAPSSLAVEAATRLGVTLVGFLRDDRLNVYAHPERVLVGAPA